MLRSGQPRGHASISVVHLSNLHPLAIPSPSQFAGPARGSFRRRPVSRRPWHAPARPARPRCHINNHVSGMPDGQRGTPPGDFAPPSSHLRHDFLGLLAVDFGVDLRGHRRRVPQDDPGQLDPVGSADAGGGGMPELVRVPAVLPPPFCRQPKQRFRSAASIRPSTGNLSAVGIFRSSLGMPKANSQPRRIAWS